VLDKGKLVIVDVRIEPAPAKPEDGAIDAPVAAASVEEAPAGVAETESTQYKREPVILVLKRLFPPDGLRPWPRSTGGRVRQSRGVSTASGSCRRPATRRPLREGIPGPISAGVGYP
jgi:hypothetical protein